MAIENFLDNTQLIHVTEVFDAMINQWGKTCKLVYPPKYVPCSNCEFGTYKTGGPMPFTFGLCPMCNSNGTKAEEVSENVILLINWRPSIWEYPILNTNIVKPNNSIETKGFMSDLPKILQCDHLVILNVDGYKHFKFKLNGEPVDQGSVVQARYFKALWNRI
jgi:hypothetical protein